MNRKFAKISMAALAGASCLLASHSSKAAIVVTATKAASSVSFAGGTYDVILFDLTNLTGADATKGNNAGNSQDAEVLGLQGTFTVTGGTGTTEMAVVGATTAKQEAGLLSTAGQGYAASGSTHSSYVAFPSDASAYSSTIVGAAGTKTTGNASSFSDTWSVTPGTGNGNVGGVEPGKDPQTLTLADGGSDPYANNGLLAEILVNPGASVSFTGQYSDYGFTAGNSTTFAYTPGGGGSTTGTNKIISLLTTASNIQAAPNGYGSTPLATLAVSPNGKATKVTLGSPAAIGYVAITGGPAPAYALALDVNGLPATQAQLNTIVNDINASNSGITAEVETQTGGPFGSTFAPGIIISDSLAGASPFFSFDFQNNSTDTTDPDSALGPVTVTSIAAVPEPATAAGVILGAAGLLLGRRKNRVQVA